MTNLSILVADDDLDDLQTVTEAFAGVDSTYRVSHVKNGVELITRLYNCLQGKNLPDLVILDINMPKMDGFQALTVIRNEKAFASLPVVVYTTSSDATLSQRCEQLGANFCAHKGSRFSQVVHFVKQVIYLLKKESSHEKNATFLKGTVEARK